MDESKQWKAGRTNGGSTDTLPPGVKLAQTLGGHTGMVTSVAFDSAGRILSSGSLDKTVRLWEVGSGNLLRTFEGHKGYVWSLAFHPQGRTLASGSWDHTVKLWETTSGRMLHSLEGHKDPVNSIAFDPQDGVLASGSGDHTVKLWEMTSGRMLHSLEGHTSFVNSVAFDPQGGMLASASDDTSINLLEAANGRLLRSLKGHKGTVGSVAFDPHGRLLASGSADRTVKLWEASSGKLLRTLEGHSDGVHVIAFSNDGRLLASKSADGTIRVWSCATWETVAVIPEPIRPGWWIPALTFHPTLPLLATAGSDPAKPISRRCQLIHLWKLDLDVLLGRGAGIQPATRTVSHTSAKIVMVGESMVGKSCLAMRIAEDRYPTDQEQGSTHGVRFWPMEAQGLSPSAVAPEGERRDVVLWDLGGQDEYRLVHQLFLDDTTVAIVLLDPTRGRTAFEEVEAWNQRLEKQLKGRPAVKLLVGAKVDQPNDAIDRQGLERLWTECGFAGYFETSALTDRGIAELREAMTGAIDWQNLAATSRPELFQRTRDEIQRRQQQKDVVLDVADLWRVLLPAEASEREKAEVNEVTKQLAAQGIISRAQLGSGEAVLVLQVHEIERYAGSLILAARNNPRGVPALELRAIATADLSLPKIPHHERLPRSQERTVLDCTVQLLVEHGICFQHEGLLVFPTLFGQTSERADSELSHTVSLYYDFSGAIDNVYASLVSWLVLARSFGRVRLEPERAEFEVGNQGLCGLRKVARPGGFAHVDVYFEATTPPKLRAEFISFVEEHLRQHDIEIREHLRVDCPRRFNFDDETLRIRIAEGHENVMCPLCEVRHPLEGGVESARQRDPDLARRTWALKTRAEQRRRLSAAQAVRMVEELSDAEPTTRPLLLLHMSDLHFTAETLVLARLQPLVDDLRRGEGMGFDELDYLVISGDFTDRGNTAGFEKAYEFVSRLTSDFGLNAQRCIFVPGNHDVVDTLDAYTRRRDSEGLRDGEWVQQGNLILARDQEKYPLRFKLFSDAFFHKFVQRPYPIDCRLQGLAIPFWDNGLQFIAMNSCWEIDEFHRKRSSIHPEALANILREAQRQEADARQTGQLEAGRPLFRIAVWHHAVAGPDQMKNTDFLGHLQTAGVKLGLHGDVHELRCDLVGYKQTRTLHIAGAGSFAAPAAARPESTPRMYNLLEISRDLQTVRVHTRCQPKPEGAWQGWHEWPNVGGTGKVAYYDV